MIDENGDKLGEFPTYKAIEKAEESNLDLVEVNQDKNICKLMDYGKHKYQIKAKSKNQKNVKADKEIRFGIHIEEHDLMVKINKSKSLMNKGHKVIFTIILKGRDNQHKDKALTLANSIIEKLEGYTLDKEVSSSGNKVIFSMFI